MSPERTVDEAWVLCSSCCVESVWDRAEMSLRSKIDTTARVLESFEIPPKFRIGSWEFVKRLSPYVPPRDWSKAQFARGIFINGPCGVGKSVGVTGIAKEWYRLWAQESSTPNHKPGSLMSLRAGNMGLWAWRFVSVPSLVMRLQCSFSNESKDRAFDLLNDLVASPFLILDDLGAEKVTEFVRQSIYYLLNERETKGRPTFITSNATPAKIDELLDWRISSRIAGLCDIQEWAGRDMRLTDRSGGLGGARG